MDLLKTFIKRIADQDEVRFLDVREILKKQIGQKTLLEFSKEHFINSGTLSYMLKGKRAVPLRLINVKDIKSNVRCMTKNCNVPIVIPNKLDNKLAYLLGLLRDGTVSEEKCSEYCCAFYSIDSDFLKSINEIVKKLFKVNSKISKFGNNYGIRIRSKTLYLFFKKVFEFPDRQVDWNTPTLIKGSSAEIKRAYISGFWDAEGGCPHVDEKNVDRKNIYAKFAQKNKESLEFIKEELKKENIETGEIHWNESKWILKVKIKSIPLFSYYIVSLHPKKGKRLEMLTKTLRCAVGAQG